MINIQENWRDSVASIIEAARIISQQLDALPRDEFKRWLADQQVVTMSTAQKLKELAHHPVISDPANFSKLPPHWGKLYEASFLPDIYLRDRINNGGIEKISRHTIYRLRNRPTRGTKKPRAGNRNPLTLPPQYAKLSDWIRAGVKLEADGMPPHKVGGAIGMKEKTYARGRTIVMLHDRKDLNDEDHKLTVAALEEMDARRTLPASLRMLEPLVKKIYIPNHTGVIKKARVGEEKKRKKDFARAISFICDTCMAAEDVKVPFIGKNESSAVVYRLLDAVESLSNLINNVRRAGND